MRWWLAATAALSLIVLGYAIGRAVDALRPFLGIRWCDRAPTRWQCVRPCGHVGACSLRLSTYGRWAWWWRQSPPVRAARTALLRWRTSHDRCPGCGRREPLTPGPCVHCGCPT